jgi:hypothetical protein
MCVLVDEAAQLLQAAQSRAPFWVPPNYLQQGKFLPRITTHTLILRLGYLIVNVSLGGPRLRAGLKTLPF